MKDIYLISENEPIKAHFQNILYGNVNYNLNVLPFNKLYALEPKEVIFLDLTHPIDFSNIKISDDHIIITDSNSFHNYKLLQIPDNTKKYPIHFQKVI